MANLITAAVRRLMSEYTLQVDPNYQGEDFRCTLCGKLTLDSYHTPCDCKYCRQCVVNHMRTGGTFCMGGKSDCGKIPLELDYNVCRHSASNTRIMMLGVVCPYESCDVVAVVSNMEDHMAVCIQKPIDCPYSVIGCKSPRTSRKRIECHIHQDSLAHANLAMKYSKSQFEEVKTSLKGLEIEKIKREEDQKSDDICIHKEINDIRSKVEFIELQSQSAMDMETLKSGVNAVRGVSRDTKNEVATLKLEIVADRELSRSTKVELESLKAELIVDSGVSQDTKNEFETLKRQIEADRDVSRSTRDEMEAMRREMEAMRREIGGLREEVEALRGEVDTREEILRNTLVETMEGVYTAVREERRRVDELMSKVDGLNMGTNKVVAVGRSSFTVDRFEEKMARSGEKVSGPYVYSHNNGYKLRLEVYPGGCFVGEGSYMSLALVVCKGEYDDVLSWPCMQYVTLSVINQETKEPYKTVTNRYCSTMATFNKPVDSDNPANVWSSFISHNDLRSITGLIVNDSVLLLVVETAPPVDIGSFTIDQFNEKSASDGVEYSPYFYTHTNGYKLRLNVHPGGCGGGQGTQMSVYSTVCKGEYDNMLTWPCKYGVAISVVNQKTKEAYRTHANNYCEINQGAFSKPVNAYNAACGKHSFISHTDLRTVEGLVVDNTVLLQIALIPPQ